MSLYQMVTSDEVIKELEIFLKDMVIDEKIQQRTEDHLLQNFNDVLIPKKSFFSRKKTVIVQTENDVLTILNDIYIPAIDDAFKD